MSAAELTGQRQELVRPLIGQRPVPVAKFSYYENGDYEVVVGGRRRDQDDSKVNDVVIPIVHDAPQRQEVPRPVPFQIVTKAAVGSTVVMGAYITGGWLGVGAVAAPVVVYVARKPLWAVTKWGAGQAWTGLSNAAGFVRQNAGAGLRGLWNLGCQGAQAVQVAQEAVGNIVEAAGGVVASAGTLVQRVSRNHPAVVGSLVTTAATTVVLASKYLSAAQGDQPQ